MDEIPPQVPGYRLTRVIGVGSSATVWRGRRVDDDELVAVKVLAAGSEDEVVREYALLQQTAAEHVVALHETVDVETEHGPSTALVLEYLAGGSLGRVVAERGHLTVGETVTVIAPVAQALAGLHDLGVVHGDLSPGNVLLDSTGRPAIGDLGCSRLTGEAPGDVHGTDGHVAPEVLEGSDPTRASDVHALGALAWLCLVGEPPGHIAERAELGDLVPDAPELVAVVESCLSTDPDARPEADEVARGVFDAAPAEPLRMTSTGDVASSLTRRLRESAADDEVHVPQWQEEIVAAPEAPPSRRWWQRREREGQEDERPRSTGGRHAAPRRRRDEPIDLTRDVEPTTEGSEPRAIARLAAGAGAGSRRPAVVVACGLALALVVLVPWRQLATAEGGSGPGHPANAVSTRSQPSETPGGPRAGVQTDRAATRESPVLLAQELTSLRRQVVVERDRAAVERLDVPGSPAREADLALLDELQRTGERYRGVTMTVRSARLQRTSGVRAVLRVVVDESAYEVVSAEGERTPRPGRRGQRVDLVLAWHDDAWRVRDVRAVAD